MPAISRSLCVAGALALGASLAHATDSTGTAPEASGRLDGMTFTTTMLVDQYDAPFEDVIRFRDGMFHSAECQHACDFGWTAYYTREEGDGIAFTATYVCETSPQTVRFEGRVTGDGIEGKAFWQVERFYWTVERRATYTGRLTPAAGDQAASVGQ